MKTKRSLRIIWIAVAAAVVLTVGALWMYVNEYYHADTAAMSKMVPPFGMVRKTVDDTTTAYVPTEIRAGLIFYPGGKVEHTAYEPLMEELAGRGVLCVLKEMPFRLAVLDVNAANGIREQFPEVKTWYIGGHSLGGSMAASYAQNHAQDFKGVLLLGAYSTADLSETPLDVLSVYGSEDGVMNRENYEENKKHLPSDFDEVIIDGGCHAYFGVYGAQDGDGTPTISNKKQIELTADAVEAWIAQ